MSRWGKVYLVVTEAGRRWSYLPIAPLEASFVPYQGFLFQGSTVVKSSMHLLQLHWCLLQHIPNAVMLHVALGWGEWMARYEDEK